MQGHRLLSLCLCKAEAFLSKTGCLREIVL